METRSSSFILITIAAMVLTMLISLPVTLGSTVGGLVPVAVTASPQERPDVAYDVLNNRYLVVYSEGSGGGSEIVGRLYDGNGAALAASFNISNHPGQSDTLPAVAYKAATKEFFVVWRYGVPAGTNDIYGRRISSAGGPIGGSIAIVTTPADESEPDVAADPLTTGRYLVVWWEIGSASNRGRFLRNDGTLDGGPFVLFSPTRVGPHVAYGSSATADYFLTTTVNVNSQVLVRGVRVGPVLGPIMQVNTTPPTLGLGYQAPVAFHPTPGRWLVAWVGQGGGQLRSRFLDTAPAPVMPEVLVVPPGGAIRTLDVAAGFDQAMAPRFNVTFERTGDIYAVPLDGTMVAGPVENIFVDGVNNDLTPAIAYGRATNQFFSVWRHDTGVSPDIYGQRHRLP